jgi:hypothetical protein
MSATLISGPVNDLALAHEPVSDELSTLGLLELLLKDRGRVERLLRDTENQRRMVPRFLALGLLGIAVYGIAVTVVLGAVEASWRFWPAHVPAAHWNDRSAANLVLAYVLGLVASNGICLPSFYFYGLLAGVRSTMLGVTAHALKGLAATSIALVGVLPIYVAGALAVVVFPVGRPAIQSCLALGLLLPFLAGLWGVRSLYEGFLGLGDTICAERREGRTCLLRRLLVAWCVCYTAVTPLAVYVLWIHLPS